MIKTSSILPIISLIFLLLGNSCLKQDESRTVEDEITELQAYLSANSIDVQPTWTGLYYIENEAGTGEVSEYYDTLIVDYSLKRLDGFLLSSSEESEDESIIVLGKNSIQGVNESAFKLKLGGSCTAIIPSALAFEGWEVDDLPSYSNLICDIKVNEIRKGIAVEPYYTDTLDMHQTASGLKYYIIRESSGADLSPGDEVQALYTGYLSDGRIFDSSVKRSELSSFTLGVGNYIQGFEEGLLLMKKGEKFRFLIPYDLAYDKEGVVPLIPPYEDIIFDVEITKL